MTRHPIFRGLATTVACCTAVLSSPTAVNCKDSIIYSTKVSTKDSTNDAKLIAEVTPHAKKTTSQELGGTSRFLTCVSTDKPIYRAGEKVYVRGVLLNASNHKPLPNGQTNATIEIKGPKGDTVASGNAFADSSVWSCAWQIPEGQAGGEYTIHITYPWDGHAPAERKFDIRSYRAPRLKSQITFLRDGYGPGEKVTASLDVKRAEGGVPQDARVNVTARVDGTEIKGTPGRVEANGLCTVSIDLPHDIPRGDGTLALVIEDGGVVETASKTIPILLQSLDLQMYPEGGDLLAGYSNRVYVQARQPNGKPADLVAKVMAKNSAGTIAECRTMHEGRGRFDFVPEAGKQYYLAISEPAGIKKLYPLPEVKSGGATIHSDKDIFGKGEPLKLHVGCTEKNFHVTVSKRELQVADKKLASDAARSSNHHALQPVSFDLPPDADGVLTVTVWDDRGMPLAERLVFRAPAKQIKITCTAQKKSYVPGDQTKVTVKTTDQDGKPVSAVVGLTVADDSVLEMVEKREQAPRLPVMYYLEPEVKDLADAHVYLDSKNPKAAVATDLLLGTQGWRRFALMELAKFIENNGDEARRVVALKIQSRNEIYAANRAASSREGVLLDVRRQAVAFAPMLPKSIPQSAARMAVAPSVSRPVPVMKPVDEDQSGLAFKQKLLLKGNLDQEELKPANDRKSNAGGQSVLAPADDSLQKAIDKSAEKKAKFRIAHGEPIASGGNLVLVREFAHQVRKDRKPTDRVDFSETLYWNAGVKTDATTGEAKVDFGLSDSVSTFRLFADAFAGDGALGATSIGIESVQPFYTEAKLPLEVTAGDHVLVPVTLVNATSNKLPNANASVKLTGDVRVKEMLKGHLEINGGQRLRLLQPIDIGFGNGLKDFTLNASAGEYADKVTRKLSIKPMGFPIENSFGGTLEPGKSVSYSVTIPKDAVKGSIVSNTAIYPTPLANMTEALQRMIQDPNGCFEQTSSTSYPLTMAQQYFVSHTGVDPKLVEQSRQKLDAGYKRLVSFWCPDRGYEWFGENPGHEALTAFGLLHFGDMAKVRQVDQNMVATTRDWLLKQKDGQGGFTRKRRSLHSWIEDKDASNAYIVWALLESGERADDLKPELASLKNAAEASPNSYVAALGANSMYLAGDKPEALRLMSRLASKQKADGSVDDVKSSIVGSGGESLVVEGTSLATLAWLRDPSYTANVEKSIKFLADSCKSGRYGSTQATVLALRAIVTYDKQRSHPKANGKVHVCVDGQSVGDWVEFGPQTQGAIKLPELSELLTPGAHKLELRMEGGSPMPYSMAVKYNATTPASDKDCKLDLRVKMAQSKVAEGNSTEANVTIINKSKDAIPTPITIVGLPGGLEPRHDQLKELVKKGKIDAYEVLGREVVLYWRALPGAATVDVPLSLIAAIPGTYTGPASRAYLYYTDEHKKWVDGLRVEIVPRKS